MKNYVVIDKGWLENRITNYREYMRESPGDYKVYTALISELETILIAQCKPLQPLIEDAFSSGGARSYFESLEEYESWAKEETDKHPTLQEYIENLKINE